MPLQSSISSASLLMPSYTQHTLSAHALACPLLPPFHPIPSRPIPLCACARVCVLEIEPRSLLCVSRVVRAWAYEEVDHLMASESARAVVVQPRVHRLELHK